ncbi:acyl-CoA synthetase [Mangrovimicrobium sediminis]|uniref:Acyl-CoA synthetase n=1 Tax=Mangrovimicrobium sediminis TaxID=2562682 RepID=A0A4Z0LXK7_9GAMM|nr:AMP-binding protein [Haliea sp. SAOS-164]TGD71906.1 acyl-CoA synthetase [Haliea sp. SAOS-164]
MPHPRETASTYPHKAAIVMGGSGEMVTYRELDQHSAQGARLLRALGLDPGVHVALLLDNHPAFLEICWAARRAGVVFIPLPLHASVAEIAEILADSGARALIASHGLAAQAVAARHAAQGLDYCFMVDGIAEGFESWEESIDRQPLEALEDEACGVPMFYALGEGLPLCGALPQAPGSDPDAPPPLAGGVGVAFGFSEETVFLSPAPLYTPASLLYHMMNLYQGGTSVVMESFEPEAALALIEEQRVTHSLWVPSMFTRLLRLPQAVRQQYELGSMQYAIHAGTPCAIHLKQQMIDWWGPVLVEYYAAGSGDGATLIDSADWLAHKGSVGKPFVGAVEILDAAGQPLPAGQLGDIHFVGDPAGTGDVGYLDAEGYLYVTDRSSQVVALPDGAIYPQELESLLMTHDKIADVAVFGLGDAAEGGQLQAVVEPENWADATDETAFEIVEWLRERVEHLVSPQQVSFSQRLPREDDGVVYKHRLMQEMRGGARDNTKQEE